MTKRKGLPGLRPIRERLELSQAELAALWVAGEVVQVEHRGLTAAQLALAWVLAQSPSIVPIPGARREQHLRENALAADVVLSSAELLEIGAAMDPSRVQGSRYTEAALALVDR